MKFDTLMKKREKKEDSPHRVVNTAMQCLFLGTVQTLISLPPLPQPVPSKEDLHEFEQSCILMQGVFVVPCTGSVLVFVGMS